MGKRISNAQARELLAQAAAQKSAGGAKKKRKNKFNAQRTTVDGIEFDSKREAARYRELCVLLAAGQILDLKLQVKIPLMGAAGPMLTRTGRQMRITVDFTYREPARPDVTIIEDAKGFATRDYEVRRAAAQAQGMEIREI